MKHSTSGFARTQETTPARLFFLFLLEIIVPLAVFASLAEDIVEKQKFGFDRNVLVFAHDARSAFLDRLMAASTHAGSGMALALACAVVVAVLLRQRERIAACYFTISFAGAALMNQLCKHVFARTRPDLWVSPLPETSFSFPSGHAMNSMAFCCALIVVTWPTRWRGIVLAGSAVFVLLVGTSRLYWGVHYPSDIIAGWAGAIVWVRAVKYVFDRYTLAPLTHTS